MLRKIKEKLGKVIKERYVVPTTRDVKSDVLQARHVRAFLDSEFEQEYHVCWETDESLHDLLTQELEVETDNICVELENNFSLFPKFSSFWLKYKTLPNVSDVEFYGEVPEMEEICGDFSKEIVDDKVRVVEMDSTSPDRVDRKVVDDLDSVDPLDLDEPGRVDFTGDDPQTSEVFGNKPPLLNLENLFPPQNVSQHASEIGKSDSILLNLFPPPITSNVNQETEPAPKIFSEPEIEQGELDSQNLLTKPPPQQSRSTDEGPSFCTVTNVSTNNRPIIFENSKPVSKLNRVCAMFAMGMKCRLGEICPALHSKPESKSRAKKKTYPGSEKKKWNAAFFLEIMEKHQPGVVSFLKASDVPKEIKSDCAQTRLTKDGKIERVVIDQSKSKEITVEFCPLKVIALI